jgi:hypothetical protein
MDMSMDTNFLPGVNYGSSSSGESAASQSASLLEQVEAEKRAKIEELLAPYRTKRTELQTKRDEFEKALEGLDEDLAELDQVIRQVEESVGVHSPAKKKKKASGGKSKSSSSGQKGISDEWVLQKLRERPRSEAELVTVAKEEGYKPAAAKATVTKLQRANVVRVNGFDQYEVI